MFLEPIIIYLILVTIFLLAAVLIVVVVTQITVFQKYSEIKKSNDQLHSSIRQKADEIIEEAIKKAGMIEKNAEISQKEISELLTKNLNEIIKASADKLDTSSEKALKDYQTALEKHLEKNIERLNNISVDIETQALVSIQKEVEQIKAEQLKRLQEKIFKVLTDASGEILNQSLDLAKHEELISQAIDKAIKREGL